MCERQGELPPGGNRFARGKANGFQRFVQFARSWRVFVLGIEKHPDLPGARLHNQRSLANIVVDICAREGHQRSLAVGSAVRSEGANDGRGFIRAASARTASGAPTHMMAPSDVVSPRPVSAPMEQRYGYFGFTARSK